MDKHLSQQEIILPLSVLLRIPQALSFIERALSLFKCETNSDEEDFLKNKAITYEKLNKARTYFVFNHNCQNLLGYFTLSFKSIDLNSISKSKKKDITAGENVDTYAAYLIGHIAKNSSFKNQISGKMLLNHSLSVILQAQKFVGGRLVYIDCKDNEKLKKFYTDNNFKYFNTSEKTKLLQYYIKI